jgi:plasmid maintenance system antidote protein VapI
MKIQNHELLKKYLEEYIKGKTREQAAQFLGISVNSLYKILAGTRRPPDWLLDRLGLYIGYTSFFY